jgi:hypothetical protein
MSDPYAAAKAAASTLQPEPMVFDLPAFCAWAKISRSVAFGEMASGRLTARRVGRKSLVTIEAARDWLNRLPTRRSA